MEKIFQKLDRYFPCGWRVAVLDMLKGRWIVESAPSMIGYLRAENANGRHILIQPKDPSCTMLADDLDEGLIQSHHRLPIGIWKPGRMVVETSPRNFQVWIRSQRPLSLEEKRYWLARLGSDPAADPNNRWGRCPGFRNRKDKHRNDKGEYPLSRLIWIDWARTAQIPPVPSSKAQLPSSPLSHQPREGGVCHNPETIWRSHYERGNESTTDFSYALALMRRGYSDDQIRSRILSERIHWDNHCGNKKINAYLERTIRRARAVITAA
jgi:hypothetical protein